MSFGGTKLGGLKALSAKVAKPAFAPKAKGGNLGNLVPSVDPALKALAYNRRKKVKLA